jgi:hypothetical protein
MWTSPSLQTLTLAIVIASPHSHFVGERLERIWSHNPKSFPLESVATTFHPSIIPLIWPQVCPLAKVQEALRCVDDLHLSACINQIQAARRRGVHKNCQCQANDWAFTCRKTSTLLVPLVNCGVGEGLMLSQESRQADSSSFRHPCTRAVAAVVLRCFKSK